MKTACRFFKCYATSMECQSTNVVLCTLTMIDLKISTDTIVKPLHVIHQRCYKIRHTRFENISIVLLTKFKEEPIMFDFLSKLNIIFCYWCHRFKIPFCMRKHLSWCYFTKMIFSTLPRFIYKHETAGNPFMYLYKKLYFVFMYKPIYNRISRKSCPQNIPVTSFAHK